MLRLGSIWCWVWQGLRFDPGHRIVLSRPMSREKGADRPDEGASSITTDIAVGTRFAEAANGIPSNLGSSQIKLHEWHSCQLIKNCIVDRQFPEFQFRQIRTFR